MTTQQRLKVKLGIKNDLEDELLEVLLLEAKDYILGYTRRNENQWLENFNGVQIGIAVINYGRQGVEGVSSRSEGGISTSFFGGATDYPESVTNLLNSYRLIKGVS